MDLLVTIATIEILIVYTVDFSCWTYPCAFTQSYLSAMRVYAGRFKLTRAKSSAY